MKSGTENLLFKPTRLPSAPPPLQGFCCAEMPSSQALQTWRLCHAFFLVLQKENVFPQIWTVFQYYSIEYSLSSPVSTQVLLSFHHPASPARERWEGPPQWAPSSFLPWWCGQGVLGVGVWTTFPCFLRPGSAGSPGSDLPKPRNTSLRPDKKENVCDWAVGPGLGSLTREIRPLFPGQARSPPLSQAQGPSFGFGSLGAIFSPQAVLGF